MKVVGIAASFEALALSPIRRFATARNLWSNAYSVNRH